MTYLNGSEDQLVFVFDPAATRTIDKMETFDDGSMIWHTNKKYPYGEIERTTAGYSAFVYYDPYKFDNSIAMTRWGAERWVRKALKLDKPRPNRPQTWKRPVVKEKYIIQREEQCPRI